MQKIHTAPGCPQSSTCRRRCSSCQGAERHQGKVGWDSKCFCCLEKATFDEFLYWHPRFLKFFLWPWTCDVKNIWAGWKFGGKGSDWNKGSESGRGWRSRGSDLQWLRLWWKAADLHSPFRSFWDLGHSCKGRWEEKGQEQHASSLCFVFAVHPPSAFLEDSLEEEEARQEAAKLEEQRKAEEAERERKKQKVWSLARKRWNQLGSRVSFWFQRCFASGQWRCGPASRHETAQLNIKTWKLWSGWKLSMCMSFEAWYSCLFALRKYSMYDEKFPIKDPEVCVVQLWLAWSPAKALIFCFKVYIINSI